MMEKQRCFCSSVFYAEFTIFTSIFDETPFLIKKNVVSKLLLVLLDNYRTKPKISNFFRLIDFEKSN